MRLAGTFGSPVQYKEPRRIISSVQLLSRVRLCDPMNCSTPGLPVHHQIPLFTQTYAHRVGDAIQPSHPLSSPPPPAPNPLVAGKFGVLSRCPWRRKGQPTPVLLLGKFPGWRSLVSYSPWGRKESDMTERLHSLSLFTLDARDLGMGSRSGMLISS